MESRSSGRRSHARHERVRFRGRPPGRRSLLGGSRSRVSNQASVEPIASSGRLRPAVARVDHGTNLGWSRRNRHAWFRETFAIALCSACSTGPFHRSTGEPRIDEIDGGPELAAVRCGLGCLGIVTAVRIPIRRTYFVEEHFRQYNTLYPQGRWTKSRFFPSSSSTSFRGGGISMRRTPARGLHLVVIALARWLPASWTRCFYRWIMPQFVPQGWKVIDRSDRQLSMRHQLFRHIETEIFVASSKLDAALEFVTLLLKHAAGEQVFLNEGLRQRLADAGVLPMWEGASGCYVQHYPICIRRILPDDTLISMACGTEPMYAISVISYVAPSQRLGFFRVTATMTKAMAHLFGGRPASGDQAPWSGRSTAHFIRVSTSFGPSSARAIRRANSPTNGSRTCCTWMATRLRYGSDAVRRHRRILLVHRLLPAGERE